MLVQTVAMAQVILFPGLLASSVVERDLEFPERSPLLRHLDRYQWHFGRDSYWFFVTEKNRFPDKTEAKGLGHLLGHRVKAEDGKYYGPKTLLDRKRSKPAKLISLEASMNCLKLSIDQVADACSRSLNNTDIAYLELNKNVSEHIANQLQLVLSFLTALSKGNQSVEIYTQGRASPPDQGVCRA
jgi:hypothetical protein